MSLECPTNASYRTTPEQKLKGRNAARLYKHGTPKLRDLLREKCRIRLHEARHACFEKSRNINATKLNVDEILRQELAELEQDINLQEEIYKELIDEVNEWFIREFEQEENYLIAIEDTEILLCPVCQKSELKFVGENVDQSYQCDCTASFVYHGKMDKLRQTLKAKIDEHEQNCLVALSFFLEPQASGSNTLNALCTSCDYFCSL